MRRLAFVLSALLFVTAAARAEDDPTAATVTEPGRSLDRALAVVLAGDARTEGKRSVLFLLDPSPALKTAGFIPAFERAVAGLEDQGERLQIGVAVAGSKKVVREAPTEEHARAVAAVRDALAAPAGTYVNITDAVRRAASALGRRSGLRELVLVTLENGDVEDDLEQAVRSLRRARVRFSCITREAFLADTYWISASRSAPRGLAFGTGDGAYCALPWGWLFQLSIANETTPSGFGPYGLGRLAAATGGRVFLEAPPSGGHTCSVYGSCNSCMQDHLPTDESFQSRRLQRLAPSVASRRDAGADMARDPCFRVLLKAWAQASKAGLLRSRPAVRLSAGGVKPERRLQGGFASVIGGGTNFRRFASRAEALAKECDRQIDWLTGELAALDAGSGSARHRAMAEFTLAMLHVTKTNLVGCAAWCREVGPVLLEPQDRATQPPEVDPIVYRDRISGVGYSNFCLCHGVKPFFEFRMPGGAAWTTALKRLDGVVGAFMRKWAHTPYAMALRHQGIARFHFTYRGTTTPPPPRPRTGSDTEKPTTENSKRPPRAGSPSTGGTGSPTTGGG